MLARELAFPVNWDGLADCLTDLSCAPAEGYVILLPCLAELAQQDYFTALDALEEAAIFWADSGVPFYVLMEGAGRDAYLPEVKAG